MKASEAFLEACQGRVCCESDGQAVICTGIEHLCLEYERSTNGNAYCDRYTWRHFSPLDFIHESSILH